ncbi:MAG TPA: nicotinate-nucleotide adenylyltransferase [Pyrinomonadaceae bacterium]|nr:nicotinate-nucleotide adenylyltransferase [Pyrinomonadaceae bacterium]
MGDKRRIGIYGGTFDPVHLGHIEVAKSVSLLFELDEVLFVPALHAPHKLTRPVTSHFHRYAMLVLATQDDPGLCVSTFELEGHDRRYTVETVAHFLTRFGDSAQLFFIMGADSWSEVTTWREWQRLLSMTNHIVVTRPGFDVRSDYLPDSLRTRIVDLRGRKSQAVVDRTEKGTVFVTDAVMREVSATEIRRAVRENRFAELDQLVPGSVAGYLKKYSLYRDSNEP